MNITNDFNFGLSFNNFSPEKIQVDDTINAVFVIDVSPSVDRYRNELNSAFNEFLNEMQNSHVKTRLFASIIEFNESITVKTGFQPILDIKAQDFIPRGRSTSLYDAVGAGIENAVNYKNTLLNTGVQCKTLVFIITDGEDNSSKNNPHLVKSKIEDIIKDEANAFSFEIILFGVGNDANFDKAAKEMGIKNLAKVGNTAKEIRKMISIISSSVSSSSTGQPGGFTF